MRRAALKGNQTGFSPRPQLTKQRACRTTARARAAEAKASEPETTEPEVVETKVVETKMADPKAAEPKAKRGRPAKPKPVADVLLPEPLPTKSPLPKVVVKPRAKVAPTKKVALKRHQPEPPKPVVKDEQTTFIVQHDRGSDLEIESEIEVETGPETDVAKSIQPVELSNLKITETINESTHNKMITFLAKYKEQDAVIRLEKTPFDELALKEALSDEKTISHRDFANDIYSSYMIEPKANSATLNSIKATFIWPASESVLNKYTRSETVFFSETPDAYTQVVEPFIDNKLTKEKDYNQWVYNILDGKSEANRVVMNDPNTSSGFMLVPDLKWTGDENDLHLVALVHRRDIRSLRDLDSKHLTLLKNILTKGTKAIINKYNKTKSQLRSYIHYQPTFYHFHVHFRMVDASDYQATDRDNLLSTVINNISLKKDYYKKAVLTYPLAKSSPLYKALEEEERV